MNRSIKEATAASKNQIKKQGALIGRGLLH
jgi:hypothetical protein